MAKDNVIELKKPETFVDDPITDILRHGARKLLAEALEAEIATLRERVNRNSRNSSRPPSSDGPEVPRESRKRTGSGRKRGGQKRHKVTTRKLVWLSKSRKCTTSSRMNDSAPGCTTVR